MKAVVLCALLGLVAAEFSVSLTRQVRKSPRRMLTNPVLIKKFLAGNLSIGEIPPLPARDFENVEYVSNIQIGTPGQTFSLVMDTGSSNLWVSSTACSDTGCSNMNKFNPGASSTYRATRTPFSLQYGTGSCSGNLAFDTTSLAGVGIKMQQFGLASTVADFFATAPLVDGIFGLGLDSLAVDSVPTPLTNMVKQGLIASKKLGISLASQNATNSRLDFGFFDASKYTGTLVQTPIVKTLGLEFLYYMINYGTMRVGTQTFNGCLFGFICEAVVDTGTSLLVGPSSVADPIIAAINLAADCSNIGTLQPFCIQISGQDFCIPPSVYVLRDGNQCQLGIQSMSATSVQFWIFGDTFLRTVYAAIDVDTMRVGFAPQA